MTRTLDRSLAFKVPDAWTLTRFSQCPGQDNNLVFPSTSGLIPLHFHYCDDLFVLPWWLGEACHQAVNALYQQSAALKSCLDPRTSLLLLSIETSQRPLQPNLSGHRPNGIP
ncbi:hypothetical protein RRG08_025709 [Elysia crispata]|uniref:Uncharacterized protein n=1 Tax=Elysia crispata TaxID=231223 RepID=A0AAE1DYJ1_9GAST|nr:hypothetical protein RRG08_025709 [Elysia crispata]